MNSYCTEPFDLTPLAGCSRIAIDGDQGAGKTSLAKEIADALGASRVSVDDFILGNGTAYIEQVMYPELERHLSSLSDIILLEGVCLLDVMDRLGWHYDHLVFAKRLIDGRWEYENHLTNSRPAPRARLKAEIAAYYKRRSPWDVASSTTELLFSLEAA